MRVSRSMCSVFLAYIVLMKHYVADVAHIRPLLRANSGFVPAQKIGPRQDRREPNMCAGTCALHIIIQNLMVKNGLTTRKAFNKNYTICQAKIHFSVPTRHIGK